MTRIILERAGRAARVTVFSLVVALFVLPAPPESPSAARHSAQTPDAAWPALATLPVQPAQTPDAPDVVTKIGERIASHPNLESWQARVNSTTSHMNSDWKPKKTTTAEKLVTVDRGRRSEEILRATETEDGKTRDVTKKFQAEAREQSEKQQRRSAGDRKTDQRSLVMTRDEVLPFGPEKRSGYDFTVKGPAELDGTPVILLQSRSRVRSEEKLEGLYYIHPETFDVLRAELTIAKKPGPLKRMEMEIDFLVLPEGYQVVKKAVMRMHVGVIIKNIRIEVVETYSDYLIPGKRP